MKKKFSYQTISTQLYIFFQFTSFLITARHFQRLDYKADNTNPQHTIRITMLHDLQTSFHTAAFNLYKTTGVYVNNLHQFSNELQLNKSINLTQEVTLLIGLFGDVAWTFRISVGTLTIPMDVLRRFAQSFHANVRQHLKVGHCSFLKRPLKFITHQLFYHSTLCNPR
jgi:hypothetical protein